MSIYQLPVTVGNLGAFLVQSENVDGSPPISDPGSRWLTMGDTLTWRKRDYPGTGYIAADGVLLPGRGWSTSWQWLVGPNAGVWGGETYDYEDRAIVCRMTQDTGTTGMQYFIGPDGWLLFDDLPNFGEWKGRLIDLADAPSPTTPYTQGTAYARWRIEDIPVLFTLFGRVQTLRWPCIITEHYSDTDADIADATGAEQEIYAYGWGRIWWAYYSSGSMPDIWPRLPQIPWPAPPERPDWNLLDARLWTNITRVSPGEDTQIKWPPF